MKRIALVILVLFAVTSCAEWQAIKTAVGSHGAEAADETLGTAIWTMCNAASTGAIARKFQTEEQKTARGVICAIP